MQIRAINTTAKTETMLSGFNPRTVREAREIAIALGLSMIADPCYDREDHCWNIYFVERAAWPRNPPEPRGWELEMIQLTDSNGYIVDRAVREAYDRIITRGGLSGSRSAEAFLRLVERYAARGKRLVW